jgi:hypothetical protein
MSTAAKVAQHKEKNPHLYCPTRRCLWRTNGGYCPRHKSTAIGLDPERLPVSRQGAVMSSRKNKSQEARVCQG